MSGQSPTGTKRRRVLGVPLVLIAAAAVLAFGPFPFHSPIPDATAVPAWATDPTPVRQPSLRPQYRVAVFDYRCSDCHRIIPSPQDPRRVLTQHREIKLNHGLNASCFNCHHRTNRDAFVDDFGEEIPWDQPPSLCAKCHGPVYRDWQYGSHGRTNGFWDSTQGPQTRRKCIECHDPHQPPFPALQPAPGPNTLRAGRPHGGPLLQERDPLRISRQARRPSGVTAAEEGG